jgi:hypothetical protein
MVPSPIGGGLGDSRVRQTKSREVSVVRRHAHDANHARGASHGMVGNEDADGARETPGHIDSV